MAEPDTSFQLIATGDAQNSKTRIELAYGAVTIHVVNALSDDSFFEIGTGNSTMAVRGTSFRASVTENEQEGLQSGIEVFEGEVSVQPINPDGSTGEATTVTAGQAAIVDQEGNVEKTSEGVVLENLDETTLEFLKTIKLDKIHLFPYSPRAGTPAAQMKPVPNAVVTDRIDNIRFTLFPDCDK